MATNLKEIREEAARKILTVVRSKGHPYVELRYNGKKFIYFCILCTAPCYGDTVLYDHLKSKLHNKLLGTAKSTMMKANPWPFNDGVEFFYTSNNNENINGDTNDYEVIPCLSIGGWGYGNGNTVDVKIREVGLGKIGGKILEVHMRWWFRRIWCEWLGNDQQEEEEEEDGDEVPNHDFGVVIFPYNYNLGRPGLFDGIMEPLSEPENKGDSSIKGKTPSTVEGSSASKDDNQLLRTSIPRLTPGQLHNRSLRPLNLSRADRKKLRRRHREVAESLCPICCQEMIPGKDMAAFFNLKTRKLACKYSSPNGTGCFHLFHTSCVIYWILLCEFHLITNRSDLPEVREGPKKMAVLAKGTEIKAVFCPECRCSDAGGDNSTLWGSRGNQDDARSELFKLKSKARIARREWKDSPEDLDNCSIGLTFPPQYEGLEMLERKLKRISLLRFYRAEVEA